MNLLFSSCSSVISLQFLLNLSSLLPFQLVVVRFLSPIDGLFAAMMKKRSNFKNCNSNSDPEKVSPHACRSPQIREILHRNSSMIVINRVSFGFDGYIFGSLTRPPEACSDFILRCNFASLVISREYNKNCLILIYDLCKFTRFRSFVESSTLCCGVVHELCTISKGKFKHQNLYRQGENLKLAIDSCCLNLCEADCYDFLDFVFRVCDVGIMLRLSRVLAPAVDGVFAGFHATKTAAMVQHVSLFVKREVCSFEVLIIVVERLLLFHSCVKAQMRQMKRRSSQNEILPQFHSYVSAHMRLMEQRSLLLDVMEVRLLSCLIKKNTSSSKWLDRHVRIGSQSCVSRQEEIWSRFGIFIHVADCVFAVKGLCLQQELFGWLKSFILVVTGCSRIEIDSHVVFALCATLELLLTQNLLQPHTMPNPLLYGLDCHGLVVQQSRSTVVGYKEIVVIKTVIIVASISQTISVVCKGLMRLFNDPFPHLVWSLAHFFAAAQDYLQVQSIDIGIIGLRILEHSSPRPHEVFMSKMRIPSHLEGEY